jgi:hypothetical protein
MKKLLGWSVLAVIIGILASPLASHAGGGHEHVGVNIGIRPAYWGPGYWGPRYWGPRVWWGPSYYYAPPPVVAQQPPTYEQPATPPQEPPYWYYCQGPQGYYPDVQQCPNGWMKVVPPANPPGQ